MHAKRKSPFLFHQRPSFSVLAAVYLFFAAVFLRTIALEVIRPRLPVYLFLEVLYLVLYTWVLLRPARRTVLQHLYFSLQSVLVLVLLALRPRFDLIILLFVLLGFQAALVFPDPVRWVWVGIETLLTVLPLVIALGLLQGLAVALLPMTLGLVLPAYIAVTQEIDAGLQKRQALVEELQRVNQHLTTYASQVDELSALQARNQLARELHDSVSQTMFSIRLNIHSAQILLTRNPDQLKPELEQLKTLTRGALTEMRRLISHLRPPDA